MKACAPRLALKKRYKTTRKRPILTLLVSFENYLPQNQSKSETNTFVKGTLLPIFRIALKTKRHILMSGDPKILVV